MWKIFEIPDNYRYLISFQQVIALFVAHFYLWSFVRSLSLVVLHLLFLTDWRFLKGREKILEIHCLTTIVHYPVVAFLFPLSSLSSSTLTLSPEHIEAWQLKAICYNVTENAHEKKIKQKIPSFFPSMCSFYRVIDKDDIFRIKTTLPPSFPHSPPSLRLLSTSSLFI